MRGSRSSRGASGRPTRVESQAIIYYKLQINPHASDPASANDASTATTPSARGDAVRWRRWWWWCRPPSAAAPRASGGGGVGGAGARPFTCAALVVVAVGRRPSSPSALLPCVVASMSTLVTLGWLGAAADRADGGSPTGAPPSSSPCRRRRRRPAGSARGRAPPPSSLSASVAASFPPHRSTTAFSEAVRERRPLAHRLLLVREARSRCTCCRRSPCPRCSPTMSSTACVELRGRRLSLPRPTAGTVADR